MDWISVKEHGFPLPSSGIKYFVLMAGGDVGYGSYDYEQIYDEHTHHWQNGIEARWYLDFDATGGEEEITHYMEIIFPD